MQPELIGALFWKRRTSLAAPDPDVRDSRIRCRQSGLGAVERLDLAFSSIDSITAWVGGST
jgi:hypothetical protein